MYMGKYRNILKVNWNNWNAWLIHVSSKKQKINEILVFTSSTACRAYRGRLSSLRGQAIAASATGCRRESGKDNKKQMKSHCVRPALAAT